MKRSVKWSIVAGLCACLAAGATLAAGPEKSEGGPPNFFEVQQYDQPFAGWAEPTLWTTYIGSSSQREQHFGREYGRDAMWAHSFEFEYGLTDRLTVGAYLDAVDPTGQGARYAQTRLLARWRFSDRQELFFNPALYVEYYLPHGDYGDHELETRLILDKDIGDYRLVLNPSLSWTTSGDQAWHAPSLGLSSGLYWRKPERVQPGIEYYADYGPTNQMGQSKQYLIPSLDIALGNQVVWHVGLALGLTSNSDHVAVESQLRFDTDIIRPSRLFGRAAP